MSKNLNLPKLLTNIHYLYVPGSPYIFALLAENSAISIFLLVDSRCSALSKISTTDLTTGSRDGSDS